MEDSGRIAEQESGDGASCENAQTVAIGVCYEYSCMICAGFGCTANLTTVPQGSLGVVTQFGRYLKTLPAGRHRYNIMSEKIMIVNMKTCCLDIPPQAVMTKDNLTVTIDAVGYYNVFDAQKALFSVENYPYALSNLVQVTLRTVIGEHTLAEIFHSRQQLNARMQELVDEASDPWGIKVTRIEMKQMNIDDKMERAMAAKTEATQEAQAKVIQAEAQLKAADMLAQAAAEMEKEPSALQLQWFETLRIIATQGRNQIVIMPSDMDVKGAMAAQATARRFG